MTIQELKPILITLLGESSRISWNEATDQAAASIMELVDKWIPVSERLPEMFEYVLVCTGGIVLKGRKYDNGWTAFYADGEVKVSNDMPVTHWQPLPPIPSQSQPAKNDD